MSDCAVFGIPVAIFLFLSAFSFVLIKWQSKSFKDRGASTKEHSERIYRDYDLYLKVTLALVAAFGYVRLGQFIKNEVLARQALILIGSISLLVMVTFCIFVICHMGSKVRRWENIEWNKAIFWQELWACFSMFIFSSGVWIAANRW